MLTLRACLATLIVLILGSTPVAAKRYMGRRIDLSFKQAELANILRLLSEVGNRNIALSPNVKARTDIQLKNTPWDKVLDDLIRDHKLSRISIGRVLYLCPSAEADKKLRFRAPWPKRRRLRGDLRIRQIRIVDALRLVLAGEKRPVLVDPRIAGRTRLDLRNTPRNDLLAVLLRKTGLELTIRGRTLRIAPPGFKGELKPIGAPAATESLALSKLRLRGVLSLRRTAWAVVEDGKGRAGLIQRGDRLGDRSVARILRTSVILRGSTASASAEERVLRLPERDRRIEPSTSR